MECPQPAARYKPTPATAICLAALSRGHLTINGTRGWQFGRRHFCFATVAELIALGLAVRDGNIVRAASP